MKKPKLSQGGGGETTMHGVWLTWGATFTLNIHTLLYDGPSSKSGLPGVGG